MTQTMRERLCRAACVAAGLDPDRKYSSSSDHPANAPFEWAWQEFGQEIDAILAELREPDQVMVRAAGEAMEGYMDDDLEPIFTAMIDAVRGEDPSRPKPESKPRPVIAAAKVKREAAHGLGLGVLTSVQGRTLEVQSVRDDENHSDLVVVEFVEPRDHGLRLQPTD